MKNSTPTKIELRIEIENLTAQLKIYQTALGKECATNDKLSMLNSELRTELRKRGIHLISKNCWCSPIIEKAQNV